MSYKVTVNRKPRSPELEKMIRGLAGAVVMKHALGITTALYQAYPVGPEHKDGSPHTRDTFQLKVGDKIVAENGQFNSVSQNYSFNETPGDKGSKIKLLTAGASFFLEFGTIFLEPRPLIRQFIKIARKDITKELRELNIRLSRR